MDRQKNQRVERIRQQRRLKRAMRNGHFRAANKAARRIGGQANETL